MLQRSLNDPAVRTRFESIGVAPAPGTRAALSEFIRSEIARWGEVVHTRGIKLD